MFPDPYIRTLKPADKRYAEAEDGGLAICVTPTGKNSWFFY